jgi:cobalt-zinc-cadmium efflux system protein
VHSFKQTPVADTERKPDVAHDHSHSHAPASFGRAFAIGVALNLAFVLLELFYGYLSHSLALVADAGHNLSDVVSLLVAWGALALAQRLPTARRTYGFKRATVLASLANAILLLVAVGAIAWEAIRRFAAPPTVAGETVIWVAAIGIVINTATALLFMSGRKHDINIRGAFLHMAADAGVSLGVVLAGIAIAYTGWEWLDPAMSLLIVGVILVSTWGLLRDSVNLALDAVPDAIDMVDLQSYLSRIPGVTAVHDLHVWGMSTTEAALTVHLVMPHAPCEDALINRICNELHDRFGVEHATIQVERGDPAHPCPLASEHVV